MGAEILVIGLMLALLLVVVSAGRGALSERVMANGSSEAGARPTSSYAWRSLGVRSRETGENLRPLSRSLSASPRCDRLCWRKRARVAERKLAAQKSHSVDYALRLAAAAYGVPYRELRAVAKCESGLRPGAVNTWSGSAGLMQFLRSTWKGNRIGRAGFSRLDPIAAALGAAAHVSLYGWSAWVCRP